MCDKPISYFIIHVTAELVVQTAIVGTKFIRQGAEKFHVALAKCHSSSFHVASFLFFQNGWTSLHWAAQQNRVDVTCILLRNGANRRAKDCVSSSCPLLLLCCTLLFSHFRLHMCITYDRF